MFLNELKIGSRLVTTANYVLYSPHTQAVYMGCKESNGVVMHHVLIGWIVNQFTEELFLDWFDNTFYVKVSSLDPVIDVESHLKAISDTVLSYRDGLLRGQYQEPNFK